MATRSAIGYALLSEAMQDWCEFFRLRRTNWAMDIVANQSVYSMTSLAPRCIEVLRASCPSNADATDDRPLILRTASQMDQECPNWRSQAASWPTHLIRDIQGPQSLRLWPTPSSSQEATVREGTLLANQSTGVLMNLTWLTSAAATAAYGALMNIQFLVGSLQLYGISGPTEIEDNSTTVETACGVSPDFQDALLWHMTARFCEMDVPIAQRDKAPGYWAKWAAELEKAKRLDTSGMQPRPAATMRGSNF
jgi:hypothetical protein